MRNFRPKPRKNFLLKAFSVGTFVFAGSLMLAGAGMGAGGMQALPSTLSESLPPIRAARPLRIVAFGSSSTEGVGATSPAATYPAQLQQILTGMLPDGRKVEVINRGIGGEDADNMAHRIQADVIARHPDVVVWQTGSNDPVHHVPLDRFERETRDGIAAMQAAGIKVILMEPQWCPRLETITATTSYRDVIRRIGAADHVEVIRRSDLMHAWISQGVLTRREMLAADGMHMTDGGYELLARSVAPSVLRAEAIRPLTSAPNPTMP